MTKQLITLTLAVLLGSHFFGHSLMNALADEGKNPPIETYYTSIEIRNGDSLWSIADRYVKDSGMTTAQYVRQLKNMNRLTEDTILTGQYLTVAYYVQNREK